MQAVRDAFIARRRGGFACNSFPAAPIRSDLAFVAADCADAASI